VSSGTNNGGVVDEGYIEDLKQPPLSSSSSASNCIGVGGSILDPHYPNSQNSESDPYSYVYDSTLLGENPAPQFGLASRFLTIGTGSGTTSILERLQREAAVIGQMRRGEQSWGNGGGSSIPGHASASVTNGGGCNNGYGIDHTVSSGQYPYHAASENEYEEIRDVARYMSMTPSDLTNNSSPSYGAGKSPQCKSFSSSEDILAEVVQVQQGHDRVLDQLNLDVENLLLRSTNEIESHSYSNISPPNSAVIGESLKSLNNNNSRLLTSSRNECVTNGPHHQQSLSMDSGVKSAGGHPAHNYSNTIGSSTRDLDLKETWGVPCDCGSSARTKAPGSVIPSSTNVKISHKKSKSETCAYCCTSGRVDFGPGSKNIVVGEVNATTTTSGGKTSTLLGISTTFGRKKKLDRAATTPFSQAHPHPSTTPGSGVNLKPRKGKGSTEFGLQQHPQHGSVNAKPVEFDPGKKGEGQTEVNAMNNKSPKAKHHRSYSLIPHWKMMRLPFLKHRGKSTHVSFLAPPLTKVKILGSVKFF